MSSKFPPTLLIRLVDSLMSILDFALGVVGKDLEGSFSASESLPLPDMGKMISSSKSKVLLSESGKSFVSRPDNKLGERLWKGYEYLGRMQYVQGNLQLCRGDDPNRKFRIVAPPDGLPGMNETSVFVEYSVSARDSRCFFLFQWHLWQKRVVVPPRKRQSSQRP